MTTPAIRWPVVRMCEDPECHDGVNGCPAALRDRQRLTDRTLALRSSYPAGTPDEKIARAVEGELAVARAKDSEGVYRIIPDGCEFTAHKLDAHDDGTVELDTVYSGLAATMDAILSGAPEWPGEDFADAPAELGERLRAMRARELTARLTR